MNVGWVPHATLGMVTLGIQIRHQPNPTWVGHSSVDFTFDRINEVKWEVNTERHELALYQSYLV